jgi:hypothetical protein
MSAPRTAALAALAVLAALAAGALGLQACQGRAQGEGDGRPSGPPPASSLPAAAAAASLPPLADGDGRLEAARVVRRFCILLDSGRLPRAAALLTPGAWPRRELRSIASFRFVSARVYAAPDHRTIVMLTRVRVRTRAPSPLPDGVATLFFTLGRVGTTTGGWLITAVRSSP